MSTTKTKIAICGDFFMLPEYFTTELAKVLDPATLELRILQQEWPDLPMTIKSEELGIGEFYGEPAAIADFIGDATIFINHLGPVSRAMLERLPQLELVAVSRGGPINLDMAALNEHNIKVVNTPGRNASAVAEFTVGMILAETRCIRIGHEDLRQGNWRGDLYRADQTGDELADLTVGLLGYGRIGVLLANLLRPFGCRLLVFDPYVKLAEPDLEQVSKEELLAQADVVTINARVTPETVGLIGTTELKQMKKTALLINVARGPLVDYPALEQALVTGEIRAAALDTFPHEPVPPDSSLLKLPNVTLTPHIAGASRRTCRLAAASIAEEIWRHLNGEQPVNPY